MQERQSDWLDRKKVSKKNKIRLLAKNETGHNCTALKLKLFLIEAIN